MPLHSYSGVLLDDTLTIICKKRERRHYMPDSGAPTTSHTTILLKKRREEEMIKSPRSATSGQWMIYASTQGTRYYDVWEMKTKQELFYWRNEDVQGTVGGHSRLLLARSTTNLQLRQRCKEEAMNWTNWEADSVPNAISGEHRLWPMVLWYIMYYIGWYYCLSCHWCLWLISGTSSILGHKWRAICAQY